MFSQELENLIQATLEDGKLEENEKAALVKRAEREGVDLDELEIYINSLLQKRARELEDKKNAVRKKAEKEKKEAFGRTCPNCGAQVPPLTLKCECGYEFANEKSASSVQLLFEKIDKIKSEPTQTGFFANPRVQNEDKLKRIINTISLFPVPNTKNDIVEFLSMAAANSKLRGGILGTVSGRLLLFCLYVLISFAICAFSDSDALPVLFGLGGMYLLVFLALTNIDLLHKNKEAKAWRDKFDQVIMKARSLRGDAEFTRQLDYYENLMKKK